MVSKHETLVAWLVYIAGLYFASYSVYMYTIKDINKSLWAWLIMACIFGSINCNFYYTRRDIATNVVAMVSLATNLTMSMILVGLYIM